MDLGWDPGEGLISFFGVDCYQGCWLYAYIHHVCVYQVCMHVDLCTRLRMLYVARYGMG